jgi:hypothetical protein
MMQDCYKTCKYSVILCKQATHKREDSPVTAELAKEGKK